MLSLIVLSVTVVLVASQRRDALQYFIDNRKILNSSFTILSNVNSSDITWVEYKYTFSNSNNSYNKSNQSNVNFQLIINVGINWNVNMPFDCKSANSGMLADSNEILEGYSIEILRLLMQNLHFKVKYTILNSSISLRENLTRILSGNNIDLLLCHPEIDSDSKLKLSELHPTLRSSYVLVYKPNRLHFTNDIFILTFSGVLWLCFLILLIILAICLHISTNYYMILYNYDKWTWVDITLWANGAACQQGLSHVPNGFSSCLVFFLGYLTSYLLYTGFAAGITSLLLQEGTNNDIAIKDLASMKLQTISITDISLLKHTYNFLNNSVSTERISDLFKYIDEDNTVGVAPKIFVDQYFAGNYELANEFIVVDLPEMQEYVRSFGVLKNSTYKRLLNNQLLILQQSGLLENTLQRSLLTPPTRSITSNYSSAGIEHVGSAILILLVGTLSSAVFLVAELIIALYRDRSIFHVNSTTL